MEYYDLYFDKKVITGSTVISPLEQTIETNRTGRYQIRVSAGGFVRIGINRDNAETLATYVTWLETNGFTGSYFPDIKRVSDVWVTDLTDAVQFVDNPVEEPV